jgi:hypothetical protein
MLKLIGQNFSLKLLKDKTLLPFSTLEVPHQEAPQLLLNQLLKLKPQNNKLKNKLKRNNNLKNNKKMEVWEDYLIEDI